MKKIVFVLLLAVVCCGVFSCNEKPKSYKFVTVGDDGKEKVENFSAKNDTDALNLYIDRMEKMLIASLEKQDGPSFTSMYVISPDGDTLNTNKELLDAVSESLPKMVTLPEGEAPNVDTLKVQ